MYYEIEMSILQAFSRVISLEEAVAYTTCSQAGLSKLLFLGEKISSGSSRRRCQLGEGGRLGNIWGSKRGHTQVLNIQGVAPCTQSNILSDLTFVKKELHNLSF